MSGIVIGDVSFTDQWKTGFLHHGKQLHISAGFPQQILQKKYQNGTDNRTFVLIVKTVNKTKRVTPQPRLKKRNMVCTHL